MPVGGKHRHWQKVNAASWLAPATSPASRRLLNQTWGTESER